ARSHQDKPHLMPVRRSSTMTATTLETATLPTPTGPHAVGRTSLEIVDPDRQEIYSSNPADRRELVLWTWYPAAAGSRAAPAAYLPGSWSAIGDALGLDVAGAPAHAVDNAPPASGGALPVLLLSPSGFSPLLMTAIGEELASHGYVVVG